MNERMRRYLLNRSDDGYEDRYEMEMRRGRDGRYLPKQEMLYEMRDDYRNDNTGEYRSESRMGYPRRIGFSMEEERPFPDEMDREYRSTYPYPMGNEMDRRHGGSYDMGKGGSNRLPKFNREMAMEWVNSMESEDGKRGEKIPFEHAKQIMEQKNIRCDPYEFWAIMNAVCSDYGKVLSKYGLDGNMEFIADLAKAWICDKDAVEEKASAYFLFVVK